MRQPSRYACTPRVLFIPAGTKAAERAAAKAAKLQEQEDFEATFADMSEQEIALIAFRAKPPVVSQAKKKKLAKEEEARLKVQLGLSLLARTQSAGSYRTCAGDAASPALRVPLFDPSGCMGAHYCFPEHGCGLVLHEGFPPDTGQALPMIDVRGTCRQLHGLLWHCVA